MTKDDKKDMPGLLGCPFCGEAPEIKFVAPAHEVIRHNCLLVTGPFYANREKWNTRADAGQAVSVTVKDISDHIATWRFSDDHDGPFGKYLAEKYPKGLIIKPDQKGSNNDE